MFNRGHLILAAVLMLYSQEAYVGTYGSYVRAFQGYSVATEINVGYMSDHEHEAEIYAGRSKEAAKAIRTQEKLFEEVFGAGANEKGRYSRFLKYLDRKRTKEVQSDYKARFTLEWPREAHGYSIYLHPVADLKPALESKLIASFVLNELGSEGYYAKYSKADATAKLRERMSWLLDGWQYTDMGAQLSKVLDAAFKSPEQLPLEAQATPATRESLLARLIQLAIEKKPVPDELVTAVLETKHANLIMLLLLFTADSDWERVSRAVKAREKELYNREWLAPLLG